MRIPSGKTDQTIFFVALDATDRVTRKTGLSAFTVYRSRNGGTATVYTTPTVAELSSSNMPGVYALTIDEDTTIASGSDSEEYAVHITATGMAPVTRTIELYRRDVTSGQTAAVDSSGRVDLGKWLGTAVTLTGGLPDVNAKTIKDGIIAAATFAANALDAVWSTASRVLTAGTNIVLAKGTGVTGLNDLDAAGVRAAVGLASANLDTQLDALPTSAELTIALAGADDATLAAIAALNNISAADVKTQADAALVDVGLTAIVTGRIDADVSSRLATTGYTAPDNVSIAAIKTKTDNLPGDPADQSLVMAATSAILDRIGAPAGLSVSADIAAVKTDTGINIPADIAALSIPTAADIRAEIDTNSSKLDAAVSSRLAATDYSAAPSANDNADALLDRADAIETGVTLRQALRLKLAVLVGRLTGAGTGTEAFRNAVADDKPRVIATVDANGNRSAITTDAT